MSYEYYQQLFEKFQSMRGEKKDAREMLRRAFQEAKDPEDKYHALSFLSIECCDHGDLDGAERALTQAAALMPDVSTAWVSLAYFLLRYRKDEKKTLRAIDEAISERCDLSTLFSYVHTERIKIGIALQRKDVVEESLRRVLDREEGISKREFQLPTEIVPALRQIEVDPALLERYLDLAFPERTFQS